MACIVSFPSPFTFDLTVLNISKLEIVDSPEYIIQDTPWKVKVSKKTIDSEQFLSIFLYCAKANMPLNWSHAASASFKLLTFDGNVDKIKQEIMTPYVFKDVINGYGFGQFLAWNDLLDIQKKYVKDDTIKIQIKIEADSNDANKSVLKTETMGEFCECSGSAKYRLTVSNIENLMAVQTPSFLLRDLSWSLMVCKSSPPKLAVRLNVEFPSNSVCEAKMTVKLISSKNGLKPIKQTSSGVFRKWFIECIITNKFISWNELLKLENGFIVNGSITLEVEVKAEKPKDVVPNAQKRPATDTLTEAKSIKLECAICKKAIIDQDTSCTPCGHLFCTPCITNAIETRKICPVDSCKARVAWNALRRMHLPIAK